MSAQIIDGKVISASIREDIKQAISHRKEQHERAPGLAVILVGEDPASQVYVKHKAKACDEVGIVSHIITLPEDIDQHTLLEQVDRYNANPHVDGILVQLPLPKHLNEEQVTERIRPDKDIDGFHPYNIGRLTQKRPTLRPCTPYGVMKMLEATGITTRGARAVIVGASNIVGRPMALELLLADATITVCNSKTQDLASVVAQADIVVVGVGRPNFVKGDWIKTGAVVIDVGINRGDDGKLVGDVEFDSAAKRASWITPVPGGVGPMTVAMLMHNTLQACEAHNEQPLD